MQELSASIKDSCNAKLKEEISSVGDHDVRITSPAHITVDIPAESERSQRRILHRVPPQVREDKKHIYDPVVLSLGPYHHGQSQFHQVEELKHEVVDIICGSKDKGFLRTKIRERIDEVRNFYGGLSKDEYDDEALAETMFRDACFVLYYMKTTVDDGRKLYTHLLRRLGVSGVAFMFRDSCMLENQIPMWLIKMLITLTYDDDDDKGDALLYKYLSFANFGDYRLTKVPWEDDEEEPLHLLEALRTTLVNEDKSNSTTVDPIKNNNRHRLFKSIWGRRKTSKSSSLFETVNSPFRSTTELKTKGIHLRPSSNCLKDIRFSSYFFYGKLQLPIWFVTNNTKVFFSNMIALEMSPETDTDSAVTSYVNFMKSLIHNASDVKELRENGILFSRLANDEEVVRMFKEIDTYGYYNKYLFHDVKRRIHEHCSSKKKTWMAELAYTYFHSPWTAIALFAAIFLLSLSFLQTYYTARSSK